MQITIIYSLIFAIISPFIFGFVNVFDKFVVSKRIRHPLGFAVLASLVNSLFGIVLAVFLNWGGISLKDLLYPALAGLLLGSQFAYYYIALNKEDASNVIGLMYFYPILVAILSFLFLNERISLISYIGMFLILLGVVLLSVRINQIKSKVSVWGIITLILVVALYEFFVKVATIDIPSLNGIAISEFFIGISMLPFLLKRSVRKGFFIAIKNIKWAFATEIFTLMGVSTVYLAMNGLPATIVSSVAAIQPLACLLFERTMNKCFGKMCRDESLLHKLIPISIIVIGVILLYAPEIILIFRR